MFRPLARSIALLRARASVQVPLRCAATRSGIMWRDQDKVPKLPLPQLNETLDRYLTYVQPLLTTEQLQRTQGLVEEFRSVS